MSWYRAGLQGEMNWELTSPCSDTEQVFSNETLFSGCMRLSDWLKASGNIDPKDLRTSWTLNKTRAKSMPLFSCRGDMIDSDVVNG